MTFNFDDLLKQLNQTVTDSQSQASQQRFTGSAADGDVSVTVTGDSRVVNIDLRYLKNRLPDDEIVVLEQLIHSALNDAFNQARSGNTPDISALHKQAQQVMDSLSTRKKDKPDE